jgi:hypothetical protein
MGSAGESPSPSQSQRCSSMARAALGLSLFALIPPLGIAAIVLGHVAESRIQSSAGLLNSKALARAALWIAYLQLALVSLVAVVLWGLFGSTVAGFQRDALAQRVLREHDRQRTLDPESAQEAEVAAKMLVYQLIAIEEEIHRYGEDGFYACQLHQLLATGTKGMTEAELRGLEARTADAPYTFEISWCNLGADGSKRPGYILTAIPQSPRMPEDSAIFCADQTGVVRIARGRTSLDCIENGQPVQ